MFSRRCPLWVSLLVLGLPTLLASQSLHDSTDVVLVQIPVTVTEDGRPVRDLGPENFVVVEAGRRQPIVSLDVFDLVVFGKS